MSDLFDYGPDDGLALERVNYGLFVRNYGVYRTAHVPGLVVSSDLILPSGSTLHIMDRMNDFDERYVVPNPPTQIPFTSRQPGRKWMYHVTKPLAEGEKFYFEDTYRMQLGFIMQSLNEFHRGRRDFKRLQELKAVNDAPEIHLPIINYNPLFNAVVVGPKTYYIRFELAFRAMLNMLEKLDRPYNYVHIPLSDVLYAPVDFLRAFNNEGMLPLNIVKKYNKDAGFFFMVHLLKYIREYSDSLLAQLSEKAIASLSFAITVGEKCIIYPMTNLMALRSGDQYFKRVIRHINTLKIKGSPALMNSSAEVEALTDDQFDEMVEKTTSTTSYISYRSDKAAQKIDSVSPPVILDLSDDHRDDAVLGVSDTSTTTRPSLLSPTSIPENDVSESEVAQTQEEQDEELLAQQDNAGSDDEVKLTKPAPAPTPDTGIFNSPVLEEQTIRSPAFVRTMAAPRSVGFKKTKSVFPRGNTPTTTSLMSEIEQGNRAYINRIQNIPSKKRQKIEALAEKYKTITVAEKPIEVLLSQSAHPPVPTSTIKALEDRMMDKSLLSSSILKFDSVYMNNMFDSDMAAVLSSFGKVGLFLVDFSHEDVVNEINQVRHYTAVFEDVNGRKHRIKYSMPIIREDGTFIVNGILNRMHKQMLNEPICKISATRVSLASNYNKYLVERVTTVAHSFKSQITKTIEDLATKDSKVTISYGSIQTDQNYPYEYSIIGSKYSRINVHNLEFIFDPNIRKQELAPTLSDEELVGYENKLGILMGRVKLTDGTYALFFMGSDNLIRRYPSKDTTNAGSFYDLLNAFYSQNEATKDLDISFGRVVPERVDLKILNKAVPVVLALGYRYGLKTTLDYLGVKYTLYKGSTNLRSGRPKSTISVKFKDSILEFSRYPLGQSLIAAGLTRLNVSKFNFDDLNGKEAYFTLVSDYGLSTNYLKGIDDFFDFFVDPLTRDKLISMNEPTNVRDLLIRATEMLLVEAVTESSRMINHRLRGYERLNALLYNEIARGFGQYRARRTDAPFSINPNAIFMKITTDQSTAIEDVNNPMHEIKQKTHVTYTGAGGRTARAFVLRDRKFPSDGVGILSECTPDSGKVAISANTTADPYIKDMRGTFDIDNIDVSKIPPGKWLHPTTLALVGGINDDAKRTRHNWCLS